MAGKLFSAVIVFFVVLGTAAGADVRNGKFQLIHVTNGLKAKGMFSSFLTLLNASGLNATLESYFAQTRTGATLLVPTDLAFKSLPASVKRALETNRSYLQGVLKLHIIIREFPASVLYHAPVGQGLPSLQGTLLQKYKNPRPGVVAVGPKGAVTASRLTNVVLYNQYVDFVVAVHGVDRVLLPA